MVISQGDVCWVDFGPVEGSRPAYRRPVVIVQCDAFNRSRIATAVCVPLTSNVRRAEAPGNVLLGPEATGLVKESVANVSQVITVDRKAIGPRVGKLAGDKLELVLSGIEVVLDR